VNLPDLGDKVNEGQALMAVGADQPLGVQTAVDEVEVRRIHQGQKALVSGQALGNKPLAGVVRSVEPQAIRENQIPVFPVMIGLLPLEPDVAQSLRLGMSAAVRIVVQEAKGAVLVPIVAVSEHEGGYAVKLEKEGKAVWQPVKTGISGHEFVEIKEGFKPGDIVLY
jgi:Membrane-fusion protein